MSDVPALILYMKPGCHLCEQARAMLDALLGARAGAGRPVPAIVERDITTDPAWERAWFDKIPVVELAGRIEAEVISPARLRRLLADVLDAGPTGPAAMSGATSSAGESGTPGGGG